MSDNDDDRFSFAASANIDDISVESDASENELKIQYATSASYEHNRVVVNWIACKIP